MITDPTVVKFSNEVARPLADRLLALQAALNVEMSVWFNTVAPAMAKNAGKDIIEDGSATDGRTPISKDDLTALVVQLLAVQAVLEGAGVKDVIAKVKVQSSLKFL